jgi:adenosylcobinamide-GDP ribazoletransferase
MPPLLASFFGAVLFYTTIPLPQSIPINFVRIAVWLPWVGILLATLLSFVTHFCQWIGFSPLLTVIFVVALMIYFTGGFHLDGAMDTADGLAVRAELNQRLEVMRDSRTGAFGVMAAIIILALKSAALFSLGQQMGIGLILAMSWSRWGQLMTIVLYDYLRKEGKGAFLKENLVFPLDVILASLFILPVGLWEYFYLGYTLDLILIINLISGAIALLVGWWFNHQLGGHTGDTYGATVEWSESLILSVLTLFL